MQKILSALFLFFGAAVIGIIYLNQEWQTFKYLRGKINRLETISRELDDLGTKRTTLEEKINNIPAESLTRISQILPVGQAGPQLITTLEQVALESRIKLPSIDISAVSHIQTPPPGEPIPAGSPQPLVQTSIQEFPTNLSISGNYHNFKIFLVRLERGLRLMNISQVSFGTLSKDGDGQFRIEGKTYHQ